MSEPLRATFKSAYVLGILSRVCDVLFYFILFRDLPIQEVGLFGWAMAVAVFVSFALDLGASQLLIRVFATDDGQGGANVVAALSLRILVTVALLVAWALAMPHVTTQQATLLLLMLGLQSTIALQQVPLAWYRAKSLQRAANLFGALEAVAKLAVVALLTALFSTRLTAQVVLAALAAVQLVLCAGLFLGFSSRIRPLEIQMSLILPRMKGLVQVGLLFVAIGLCTVLQNRLDWLLISSYAPPRELAGYSLANKGYEFALMFFGIGLTTVYPWLCRESLERSNREKIDLVLRLLVFGAVAFGWLSAAVAPEMLTLLFADKYQGFEIYAAAFAALSGYSVMVSTLYFVVLAARRERLICAVCVGATVLQAGINLILVPKIGAMGALLGMCALVAVTLGAYVLVARTMSTQPAFDPLPLLLASLVFGGVSISRLALQANSWLIASLFVMAFLTTFTAIFPKPDRITLLRWIRLPVMRAS